MTPSADTLQLTISLVADATTDLAEICELTIAFIGSTTVTDALLAGQALSSLSNSKSPTQLTSAPILLTLAVTAIPSTILLIQQWLLRQQNQTLKAKIGEVELEVPRNAKQDE